MTAVQASSFLCSSSSANTKFERRIITKAAINIPRLWKTNAIAVPKLPNLSLVEDIRVFYPTNLPNKNISKSDDHTNDPMVMAKLYGLMDAISDRVEMHKNIGEQRINWNSLLLTSINTITLAAATMSGIAGATSVLSGGAVEALKISSTMMYLAATGMLLLMNKIQPSQLAEEQRNATRLFIHLLNETKTVISIGKPTINDVKKIMEKVLALDKAYPLPLLGVMLEKFPSSVEPAVWWPQQSPKRHKKSQIQSEKRDCNGWNRKLEEEMREIIRVIRKNDKEDYIRLGGKALKLNKILAVCGPLLTGVAAIGSAFVGSPTHGSLAVMVGVVGGALATIVNSFEHGAQVGMVFEMYRANAGFFKLVEESIEANLVEKDYENRENGELFEMKLALQLGRSLSEMRDLAASSSSNKGDIHEFASKLF